MNRLLFLAAPLLLAAFASTLSAQELAHTSDSLEVIKKNVDAGKAVLLDVRTQAEWERGHIKGAVHLPLAEILEGKNLDRLPKDKIIYSFCEVGKRSLAAGKQLEKQGLTVCPLKPGFRDLVAAGFLKGQK